jgi:D-apionolactonase
MELRAGNLRMIYDRGFLRYISLGNYEVLRMIYFALRDHHWDTMDGAPRDEVISVADRSFNIEYQWVSESESFPFIWDVIIEGKENSEIIFTINGKALKDVWKNRTGFCVLHPIPENAGRPCTVFDPEGNKVEGIFPFYISPHQPFLEIAQMQWPLSQYGRATLDFSGDIFEMEDQRNWCDDSYKTYCTPQRIPFPALLKKDETIHQEVRLLVETDKPVSLPESGIPCLLKTTTQLNSKPKIGVSAPSGGYQLTGEELKIICDLEFDHYRFEIDFSRSHWPEVWDRRVREAIAMQFDLEVWLYFSDQFLDEASQFAGLLDQLPAEMKTDLLILHKDFKTTPDLLLEKVTPILQQSVKTVSIGAGTDVFFTELNRERVKTDGVEFISYPVNPQVHAFDNATMAENTGAQAYTVESARHYFNGLPVHVSPVTLRPRLADDLEMTDGLPADADIRQTTLFGAAWTLASLAHLSSAGADSITYFEVVGPKGIIGSSQPLKGSEWSSGQNNLFPIYHVLKCFLKHKSATWLPFSSTRSLDVKAFGFREGRQTRILLANLSNRSIPVRLEYPASQYKRVVLDGDHVADSYRDEQYLEDKLQQAKPVAGGLPGFELGSHAIVYTELLD